MSLRDDLMEVDGVGEATADSILEVIDGHNNGVDPSELERIASMLERGGKSAALSRLNDLLE